MNIKNKEIKMGDHLAFNFQYNSDDKPDIQVGEVIWKSENKVSVIFLYGYKSVTEDLTPDQILAVVDKTLQAPRIKMGAFLGHFVQLNP